MSRIVAFHHAQGRGGLTGGEGSCLVSEEYVQGYGVHHSYAPPVEAVQRVPQFGVLLTLRVEDSA
jgi:hypothetical protein